MITRISSLLLLLSLCGVAPMLGQNVVQNVTYGTSQTATVVGPTTLTANTAVTVPAAANISYRATSQIILGPGFTASSGATFTAAIVADTILPTIDSHSSSNTTLTGFTVSWTASDLYLSGSAGLINGFEIQLDSGAIESLPSTTLSRTYSGLSAGTAYLAKVRAQDAAGNWSTWNQLSVNTALDPTGDADGDGVSNGIEVELRTNPNSGFEADTNNNTNLNIHQP